MKDGQANVPVGLKKADEVPGRLHSTAVAFVTLMILEVALSIGLFHRSIGEYFAGLVSLAGAIGLAAQVCFATFPLLDVFLRRRSNLLSRAPL